MSVFRDTGEGAIFLYRKNIDENAKSLATAILTDNFRQPYKGINVDYTPFLSLLKSKKWILIGYSISQRVSDLLELSIDNVRQADNNGLYLDINQKKQGNLLPLVLLI